MTEIKVVHEYNKPNNNSQSRQNTDYYDERTYICTSRAGMIFHGVKSKHVLQSEKIHVPKLDAKW